MLALFNYFTLDISKEDARLGCHPGPCGEDIAFLLNKPKIKKQLDKIPVADIKLELKEHGAWDETELADHQQNRARILWIACADVVEQLNAKRRKLGY